MNWNSKPPVKRKNSREKGARGERFVVAILKALMERVEGEVATSHGVEATHSENVRRTAKPRFSKGRDLEGVPELCIEVKNTKANLVNQHWEQCLRQQREPPAGRFPVLFYNRNRAWHVRTYASLQNPSRSNVMQWIVCDYSLEQFLTWYAEIYRELITR